MDRTMVEFTSLARVNSLYWITSLEPTMRRTTERVHDDLHPFFVSIGLSFKFFEPQTAAEFSEVLDRSQQT
jgi:hypothetical protein